MKQPDFGAFFHAHEARKLSYELRGDANLPHDLAYLASYLHDATFLPSDMKLRGRTLTIPLVRDSWELYRHLNELYAVKSTLAITHVAGCAWQIGHDFSDRTGGLSPRRRLMIYWIELVGQASGSAEAGHLVLYNPYERWRLSVAFEEEADWRVRLRDLEVPHAKRRKSVTASPTRRQSAQGTWRLDG